MCSVLPNLLQMEKDQQISLPQKLTIQQHQHQQYALKWSEFQSSIINCFQRLRDEEDFVDVTISCDQRSFTAHRVVLSACSPYFRKLLKSNPCKHPIIILRDVGSDDMECLLSFMYNGEVNVAHDQLPDFLKTAHLLQIRGLADVTENWRSSGHITATKPIDNSIFPNKKYQPDPDKDNFSVGAVEKTNILPKCKSSSERPVSSTMVSSYSSDMNRNSPVIKEMKTPGATPENIDTHRSRKILLTPPPQKRIKSADLFRAQHGINTNLQLSEGEFSAISQHSLTRERRHNVSDFERKMERIDVKSTNDESGDDESNCSSDYTMERVGTNQEINDSEDNSRPMMHNVFLNAAKPLEQQSILNLSDFGMGITQDPRAAATLHAAKIAHLSAIGKSFDNLPSTLIQAQLDLSKDQNSKGELASKGCRSEGFQIGSILRQHPSFDTPINDQIFSNIRKEQNASEITPSKDTSQPTTTSQPKDVKTYDLIEESDLNEKKSPNA